MAQRAQRGPGPWRGVVSVLVLALAAGCTPEPPAEAPDPTATPQAVSLLGEKLYALPDASGEVAGADAALAEAPDDVELLLAAARARWTSWQYQQAIDMYDRVIELAPDDWRPYTFRGIRQVSVREFDGAVRDLERALELAPLNYDVAYYLGFAYYLTGRFDDASDVLLACFALADDPDARAAQSYDFRSCSQISDDVDWRVAITDWTVRSLRRAGRHEEAQALLDTISPGMAVEASLAYYHDLLFYKGLMAEEQILTIDEGDPYTFETVAYGVAAWHLAEGNTERAVEILEQVAAHPRWPGFGRIAAEVDLARLRQQ